MWARVKSPLLSTIGEGESTSGREAMEENYMEDFEDYGEGWEDDFQPFDSGLGDEPVPITQSAAPSDDDARAVAATELVTPLPSHSPPPTSPRKNHRVPLPAEAPSVPSVNLSRS